MFVSISSMKLDRCFAWFSKCRTSSKGTFSGGLQNDKRNSLFRFSGKRTRWKPVVSTIWNNGSRILDRNLSQVRCRSSKQGFLCPTIFWFWIIPCISGVRLMSAQKWKKSKKASSKSKKNHYRLLATFSVVALVGLFIYTGSLAISNEQLASRLVDGVAGYSYPL